MRSLPLLSGLSRQSNCVNFIVRHIELSSRNLKIHLGGHRLRRPGLSLRFSFDRKDVVERVNVKMAICDGRR